MANLRNSLWKHIRCFLSTLHCIPEEFENGGFSLKTRQSVFSAHTILEEFENRNFSLKTHKCFPSTSYRSNLKTEVSLRKRIKCFRPTLRRRNIKMQQSSVILGPVHTNLFSNDNGAVLLRIQLSSTLQRRKRNHSNTLSRVERF